MPPTYFAANPGGAWDLPAEMSPDDVLELYDVETATHAGHLDIVRETLDGKLWLVLGWRGAPSVMMAGMVALRTATVCAGLTLLLAGCGSGAAPSPGATSAPSSPIPTTSTAPTATATPTPSPTAPPPFIARVHWVRGSGGRSLHIVPTASGRVAQGSAARDEAWSEVLRLAPDADQPGMRAQFDCHWAYARLVQPDKPSWNIEPWRPVVTESQMADAGCNPGGPESAEG